MTGRSTLRVTAWLIAGLASAGLAFVSYARLIDQRWAWQTLPARMHFCGRDYSSGGQLVSADWLKADSDHVVGHFLTLSGLREVWGSDGPPGDRCGTVVYVPAGRSGFGEYALQGGP